MLCPYCGDEMQDGCVESGSPIFWEPDKRYGEKATNISGKLIWNDVQRIPGTRCKYCDIIIFTPKKFESALLRIFNRKKEV